METETMRIGPITGSATFRYEYDEMDHNIISLIIVSFDTSGVKSIQFGYIENGALVMSKRYGSSSLANCSSRVVRLNYESEFVTGLSGEVFNGLINSLTIHTNQRKHEVFHLTFEIRRPRPQKVELHPGILQRCEFRGFFGSFDYNRLISIGLNMKLVLPDVKTVKNEKV